jgi:hypothetical protein
MPEDNPSTRTRYRRDLPKLPSEEAVAQLPIAKKTIVQTAQRTLLVASQERDAAVYRNGGPKGDYHEKDRASDTAADGLKKTYEENGLAQFVETDTLELRTQLTVREPNPHYIPRI